MIPGGHKEACSNCGKRDVVLLKRRLEGGTRELVCVKCADPKSNAVSNENMYEEGDYIVRWKLRDQKTNKSWIEEMHYMSLADFEVAYGNIIHEILWIQLRKNKVAIL